VESELSLDAANFGSDLVDSIILGCNFYSDCGHRERLPRGLQKCKLKNPFLQDFQDFGEILTFFGQNSITFDREVRF
jgi:hypothetical protein